MLPAARCAYATLAELFEPCAIATANRWLTQAEWQQFQRFRSQERQATWLAGRVLAKRLVIDCYPYASWQPILLPSQIDICSCSPEGRGQRPLVFVKGAPWPCTLSLAHTSRGALAAIGPAHGPRVGVDLVEPTECDPHRLQPWWTAGERRWLGRASGHRAAPLWATKEALFKACNEGESFAPRQAEVLAAQGGRIDCCYRGREPGVCLYRSNLVRRLSGCGTSCGPRHAADFVTHHEREPRQ